MLRFRFVRLISSYSIDLFLSGDPIHPGRTENDSSPIPVHGIKDPAPSPGCVFSVLLLCGRDATRNNQNTHSNLWNGAIFSYMMYTLGPTAIQHLGRRQFLALYLLGGAFSQRENTLSTSVFMLLSL